jgi:hypothetical protein
MEHQYFLIEPHQLQSVEEQLITNKLLIMSEEDTILLSPGPV